MSDEAKCSGARRAPATAGRAVLALGASATIAAVDRPRRSRTTDEDPRPRLGQPRPDRAGPAARHHRGRPRAAARLSGPVRPADATRAAVRRRRVRPRLLQQRDRARAPSRRAAFAAELRRVARGWYVQTPAVSFPIEPHSLLPGAHWLPRRLRGPYWWLGAGSDIDEINLLPRRELETLFGPARRERFGPLTKSWIALRRPDAPAEGPAGSEPYEPDNFLDRHSRQSTLDAFYAHEMEREAAIVRERLGLERQARCCQSAAVGTPGATCSRRRRSGSPGSTPTRPRCTACSSDRSGRCRPRRIRRPARSPALGALRRRALPARPAPHRLSGAVGPRVQRGRAAAAPRWRARRDRAGAVASGRARAWPRPTDSVSASPLTGLPTTFRSRRDCSCGQPETRAYSPSCTRSPTGGAGCHQPHSA